MTDVKELLRRWQAGSGAREIERAGIANRKTVGRYLKAAEDIGVHKSDPLTDELVAHVASAVQQREELPPSAEWRALEAQRAQIADWLQGDRPLRLVRVHELLERRGVDVSYMTLSRFAHRELGWRERRPTVRIVDRAPGDEAQIDFGDMGFIVDEEGKRRLLRVLVVLLAFSRYMFVWPTFTQKVGDVCEGLEAAWRFFGGVVKRVVVDNMSTAVTHAHPTAPRLNRSFAEYAQARGFLVDPARVRRPQDKAGVENQVAYVRERWFDGEKLGGDLREIRAHAARWCHEVAGARVHGTTRLVPLEVFESEERAVLLPLPETTFDVPEWSAVKVHPDHHVQVARSLYSVPSRYIGKQIDARADRTTVKLYASNELIVAHLRVAPGKRSTDPSHYPKGTEGYAFRSIDGVKRRAREQGERVGEYMDRLLEGPLPWTRMRQAYGLLRLCERFGAERVNAVCARAMALDVIDVPRVERLLRSAEKAEAPAVSKGVVTPLPRGRFERDNASFSTLRKAGGGSEEGGNA